MFRNNYKKMKERITNKEKIEQKNPKGVKKE
jgi:hypothetical protein